MSLWSSGMSIKYVTVFPLRNRGIWAYLLNIFSYSSFTALYISNGIFENEPSNIYQKSSDKAEYHTNEGEGKEKLKGLRSASEMCSIDWQYLSLGYLERNEFSPKVNLEVFLCLKIMFS